MRSRLVLSVLAVALLLPALLRAGPQNPKPKYDPAFHAAVNAGDLKTVKRMLKKEPGLALGSDDGWTPLHKLFDRRGGERHPPKALAIAKLLIAKGADPNADSGGSLSMTPLSLAAATKAPMRLIRFLIAKGADVHWTSPSGGWTLLHFAAGSDHIKLMKYLIEKKGLDVNARATDNGMTPLHAASSGDPATVRLLLKHGASPLYTTHGPMGRLRPLDMALRLGKPEVVKILRKATLRK